MKTLVYSLLLSGGDDMTALEPRAPVSVTAGAGLPGLRGANIDRAPLQFQLRLSCARVSPGGQSRPGTRSSTHSAPLELWEA